MAELLRVNNHIIIFNVATKGFGVGVDPFGHPFSIQGPLYAFQVESQRHGSKINEVTCGIIQLFNSYFCIVLYNQHDQGSRWLHTTEY